METTLANKLTAHEPDGTCYCYVEGWIAALESLSLGQGTWSSAQGPINLLLNQGYAYMGGDD